MDQESIVTPESALAALRDKITIRSRYDNFIGGEWVAPAEGRYFENLSPINGRVVCESARSTAADVERALDAAHAAKAGWASTSPTDRAAVLLKIADRMEQHLTELATVETIDNGKPIRETMAADIPLAIDHFRYFASCIRTQEGSLAELDDDTVAYHFHEPLGVVGQIIPWNFPILMAAWKLAPALAAGNCVVLKPAEQTPMGDHGVDGAGRRPAAAGRAERRQRLRRRGRQAAGVEQPAHREGRVHRRDDDRSTDHAVRVGEPDPGHAGAGRQDRRTSSSTT
jgi:hypothetical protein